MTVALVPDGLAGERIDLAASRMTGLSRSRVDQLAAAGGLVLNGQPVAKSHRVQAGDLLEVVEDKPARRLEVQARSVAGLGLVYQDADLVVVDKPAGVAAHPSLGWDGPSVVEHLAAAGIGVSTSGAPEREGIVQRLDVGTSGLMVVARSEFAYSALKAAFRQRRVRKIYQAVAQGYPDPSTGTIDAAIGHHRGPEWKMAVSRSGRPAVTHYRTLAAGRGASLLEIELETGRTHQIRVHLSAIHHPCLGDLVYGADPALAARLELRRQWLHAVELAFPHPRSHEQVTFHSEPAPDLAAAWAVLRAD
ncbi:MAG: RluA family pseudouridine synthase [Propionibacteriaceae bacterium]|nr:RluA family pseudouridine synthase [Propionibacteriaceae bacterium]